MSAWWIHLFNFFLDAVNCVVSFHGSSLHLSLSKIDMRPRTHRFFIMDSLCNYIELVTGSGVYFHSWNKAVNCHSAFTSLPVLDDLDVKMAAVHVGLVGWKLRETPIRIIWTIWPISLAMWNISRNSSTSSSHAAWKMPVTAIFYRFRYVHAWSNASWPRNGESWMNQKSHRGFWTVPFQKT